jgi:hypothetical protein
MNVFKGQNFLEFSDRFKTDEDCKKYLASVKSEIRYKCLRCNHITCQVTTDFYNSIYFCGIISSTLYSFMKMQFKI